MKFTDVKIPADVGILYNSDYVAMPYDCTELSNLADDGVIKAGKLIPSNDAKAVGVLLHDVILADNPNGTVVIRGFIKTSALPEKPNDAVNIPLIKFMEEEE